jgi:alanyl-tRNA synthetase
MDATQLRRAFVDFFVQRGHTEVKAAPLIPHHPTAPMFTNSGMMPFVPYFLGEEPAPWPRATSVQKCVRAGGKHNDLDAIGRSLRHLSFFEMLGNFSFGDYFKADAIPWAWEFVTETLGLDGERIWVTVHVTDDEAEEVWRDGVGFPGARIQRLDKDNFWEMGDTGPCGPSSEIFWDYGPELGQGGGPAGGAEERFVELWNLVFMQYFRHPDGELTDLPKRNVDTGAGLERILAVLAGSPSLYEADTLRALVETAEALTGRHLGDDPRTDVAVRLLADHARTMTFLVNDGVFPSNEDRGYVLRRIIRRAVRFAYLLGVEQLVTPPLVRRCVEVMAGAYPELLANQDFVVSVISREEERFRANLKSGLALLDQELEGLPPGAVLPGVVAFKLHDTFGFPLEVTQEVAAERSVTVDDEGFSSAMDQQRRRARESAKGATVDAASIERYREILDQFGPTDFTGYREPSSTAHVLAVLNPDSGSDGGAELFLDRTPFYAEGGGQVGDTGTIRTASGVARVLDTTYALPGLHCHRVAIEGEIVLGQEATAAIDVERREAIRRNHTGTHLLHWALREVLGPHVKQAGSLVAPDRLRFDFSHYGPVTAEQLHRAEDLVNRQILSDEPVLAFETSKAEADQLGAIAFFGDKYGEVVRVVEAGSHSVELCGGTHVSRLGMIGPLKVTSEQSIGSNLRRIEAVTGLATIERLRASEETMARAADLLRTGPEELLEALERRLAEWRATQDELKALRSAARRVDARALATAARSDGGRVVARRDSLGREELRELATTVRAEPGMKAVVVGGSPGDGKVVMVAAVAGDSGLDASDLLAEPAKMVGGGVSKNAELAIAGGRDPSRLDEALSMVRSRLGLPPEAP